MTPEGRSHFIFAQDGWEEVADDALDWAMDHLAAARETGTGRQEPA
ncbi:MAG: hypothetical protein ACRDKY_05750 [Solirubrobacteraceae bacterium]